MNRIGVIGAGAWGTALAATARRAGADVLIWGRDGETVATINRDHENRQRLPGVALDPAIRATGDPADFSDCEALLLACPAQAVRTVLAEFAAHIAPGTPVVICAKGIERDTGLSMAEVVSNVSPEVTVAVLSGPSFAGDVASGKPTAVTLACADEAKGHALLEAIGTRTFRPYYSSDVTGTQIGGSAKNVLAIASGIVDGRDLGASASAALITRGFAELARLGMALGARPDTLAGLSGLGDLVLTCGSRQSRNMAFGHRLGTGSSVDDALAASRAVAEGVWTAPALVQLARDKGIEMPIAFAVDAVLARRMSVDEAIESLLARPFRAETG
ncbi:NAD(P)H-dependent glycerol-3-phosphate dehydrogenase [Tepidamorphus sp. 3E244]|uniref:NAD(P)H-dependent glycerol-3-phosphate dehydrogenase n=1 Tax=Tepidamorphus sp. 3E244 TaxID=3385498 RepID=UPI0038FC017F